MDANQKANQKAGDEGPLAAPLACLECGAGVMHLTHITYFTWLNEELVTVPNFPAWVCDLCGRREFDPRAVAWLNTLLDPATGRKPRIKLGNRRRPTGNDPLRP